MKIFKYPLLLAPVQVIYVPSDGEFLTVQDQNGVLTLWAQVNEFSGTRAATIRIYGTGDAIIGSQVQKYLGTVQLAGYVWHVYADKS